MTGVQTCALPILKLDEGDVIVTAWAEHNFGPGWTASPGFVQVLIQCQTGVLRTVELKADEQSAAMRALFQFSADAHSEMTRAAMRLFGVKT